MKNTFYVIESYDLDTLNRVCSRLYNDKPVDLDLRRDLARDIEGVIENAQNCPIEEARLYRPVEDEQ